MTSKIKASTHKVIKSSTWKFSGHHYDLVNCCHRWPQICFICRSHSHILLFSFMIYHWISSMSNTTGATSVEGLANPVHLRSFHVLVPFVLLNLQILRSFHVLVPFVLLNLQISWTIVCIFVFLLLVLTLSVHRPFVSAAYPFSTLKKLNVKMFVQCNVSWIISSVNRHERL